MKYQTKAIEVDAYEITGVGVFHADGSHTIQVLMGMGEDDAPIHEEANAPESSHKPRIGD
jgi:hypothetical protein